MEDELTHEFSAAYALDALGDEEARAFEEHLRHCDSCRVEVAEFLETSAMLAYATPTTAPPHHLRDRIIARATDRPRARRYLLPRLVAATAIAATIAFAIWATLLHDELRSQRSARAAQASVLRVIADPGARRVALVPPRGTLIVAPDRTAALVLLRTRNLAKERTYQAWVTRPGESPRPAGIFPGGDRVVLVRLTLPVPAGAVVMTTIEPAPGSKRPTGPVQVRAQA